eukprot:6085061-Ditylum_brightwellii.AAC.1
MRHHHHSLCCEGQDRCLQQRKSSPSFSKTIQLAQKQSPVYREDEKYILSVERCIEGMRREDPPSIPQLAVPIEVPIEYH